MREIRFRAWSNEDNFMLYEDDEDKTENLVLSGKNNVIAMTWGNWFKKFFYEVLSDKADWIAMQYTGLKDKLGKEIYEGDIIAKTISVRTGTQVSGRGRNITTYGISKDILTNGVVEWNVFRYIIRFNAYDDYDSYFYVSEAKDKPRHIHSQVLHDLICTEQFEVIGNRYENPELIKQ